MEQQEKAQAVAEEKIDVEAMSRAIADLSAAFRPAFDEATLYERKKLLKKAG